MREERIRFTANAQTQRRLLERFAQALDQPTEENLHALFAEDALHLSDGGGLAVATLRPLLGAKRIARLYVQVAKREQDHNVSRRLHMLNGAPVLLTWAEGRLVTATWIECDDDRIVALHALRNPKKLARLAAVTKSADGPSLH